MNVCGIDVSTKAVDLVLIPVDDGPPVWHRYKLTGADAWERTRSIRFAMPDAHSTFYDNIAAIGVENPAGTHGAYTVQRAVGAVLACLPPLTLVQPWRPSEWRKAVGLKGNCSKQDVWEHAWEQLGGDSDRAHVMRATEGLWPYDAADAWCIALATRHAIEETL